MPFKKRLVVLGIVVLSGLCLAVNGAEPAANARRPTSDASLRRWLENMVCHHRFSDEEITAATGLSAEEIAAAKARFHIDPKAAPARPEGRLHVVPYPGGRHPRIGFLDGAVDPQRETKISVFTPWDDPQSDRADYVVVDVPEALWSNLGLTYLAHTHVPTVWTKRGIDLDPLEWQTTEDGRLTLDRLLPNGIAFHTTIVPQPDHVRMSITLTNGTDELLTDLRVQNCVMLKGAEGFTEQSNAHNVTRLPYVARHDPSGTRWIITAWLPAHRAWANEKCPCLHSDPRFEDCPPGETRRIDGWLSFYEGTDIQGEFDRIDATEWWRTETPRQDADAIHVSGTITVNGRPLTDGAIVFQLPNGQFFGSRLRDNGQFTIDGLAEGEYAISIAGSVDGQPLPEKYSSPDNSLLRVTISPGENVITFDLDSR
ncbi:MAG: hypothetical protein KF861_11095 [Planctomycetaceae bacterium]|nr:hypothetical protein [Planctomycetaceae bacterium]